jgi:hypothetical protein
MEYCKISCKMITMTISKIGVGVSLPVETVRAIDNLRGEHGRSEIIRQIIDRGLESNAENEGGGSLATSRPPTPGVDHGGNQ